MTQSDTPNHLLGQTSLYLQQHLYNPVDWHPWGTEAFDKAENEDKLILLSIGYSSCHWCHVMEDETFSDPEIGLLMNQHFICIKVDREERPDIDQIYIEAVQIISGTAGWPLNCFLLTDGRPFFGGTYFKRSDWVNIISKLSRLYKVDKGKINSAADQIYAHLKDSELIKISDISDFSFNELEKSVQKWKTSFDLEWGGSKGAPKFIMPSTWLFLLRYIQYSKDQIIPDFIHKSLVNIISGGIYDHLAGGFSRYSTDKFWRIPHFEKMLYDNGQLLSVFAEAFRNSGSFKYKFILEGITSFLKNQFLSSQGAFFSALDADSDGEEGKFYTWEQDQFQVLPEELLNWFIPVFNIAENGNWENTNVLYLNPGNTLYENQEDLKKLSICKEILLKERQKRIAPALDTKIITSWNAMTISGLLDSYRVTQEINYRELALKVLKFLLQNHIDETQNLYRVVYNKNTKIVGLLEDYAFLIEALIKTYQATLSKEYLQKAIQLTHNVISCYYNPESPFFYQISIKEKQLLVQKTELIDQVIPSANSTMAKNLLLLGWITSDTVFTDRALEMIRAIKDQALLNPEYHSNWLYVMDLIYNEPFQIHINPDSHGEWFKIYFHSKKDTLFIHNHLEEPIPTSKIQVCRNKTCNLLYNSADEVLKLIDSEN